MTYPPQPGYQPMPYHPAQLDGEGKPSGGTAITAGVLAILGGLLGLFGVLGSVIGLAAVSQLSGSAAGDSVLVFIVVSIVELLMTVLLLGGGILLLNRKRAGQFMVAGGAGLAALGYVFMIIAMAAGGALASGVRQSGAGAAGVGVIVIAALPAIATVVLSLIPPTTRYVKWRAGMGATYPSAPGYGAPQQPYGSGSYGQQYDPGPYGGGSQYGAQPPYGQQPGKW